MKAYPGCPTRSKFGSLLEETHCRLQIRCCLRACRQSKIERQANRRENSIGVTSQQLTFGIEIKLQHTGGAIYKMRRRCRKSQAELCQILRCDPNLLVRKPRGQRPNESPRKSCSVAAGRNRI